MISRFLSTARFVLRSLLYSSKILWPCGRKCSISSIAYIIKEPSFDLSIHKLTFLIHLTIQENMDFLSRVLQEGQLVGLINLLMRI